MKTRLIYIACITGLFHLSGGALASGAESAMSVGEIAVIKAQEFARALAQLKIREIAIERATPVDTDALALIRAQQGALEQELVKLAIAPLELKLQRASKDRSPGHPEVLALRAEIEERKAALSGGK